ncbi:MAG: methylated-DNA--[protein]-cysteine S-methyltransferase [Nitrospirae bacterium]|nr:methylated-DNA--[protein]-cysteine S-methyltransferase [Nitrospirota bacterium]
MADIIERYDCINSPIGVIYVVFVGEVVKAVTLVRPQAVAAHPLSSDIRGQFEGYFAGKRVVFDIKVSLEKVSKFCASVYKALEEVLYGEVCTYGWLARRVGTASVARAVGQALKKNPLPIIIPCHRVIASDGSLGGYSLGLDVKRQLLDIERNTK